MLFIDYVSEKDPANAFSGTRDVNPASRDAELERTIGRLTLKNNCLRRAWLKLGLQRAASKGIGEERSTQRSPLETM
ncbi:MAG TPA: hypothetical protein VG498_22595 [Terriglobales bacterium]|nr:hypothetical protein [Terriglobales bacterium]